MKRVSINGKEYHLVNGKYFPVRSGKARMSEERLAELQPKFIERSHVSKTRDFMDALHTGAQQKPRRPEGGGV